ncbi:cation:proton antiporter [Eubacteriaceae bacterium ES3]|nr:cation:proton antiporter [Eubacteriaceae bacterium ES3]
MQSNIIFEVFLMLFAGIIFGRIVKFFKMPNVTGYLVAGLILGPSFLNFIPSYMVEGFGVISDIALGFIAFSVGSQFDFNYFKKVGPAPIIIAIFEAITAVVFVIIAVTVFGFDIKLAIMLGAIAAATAPAQTIMVIKQYRAKGPLTSMLMSVVAVDDAVALIAFGFASTLVNMMSSTQSGNLFISILTPVYELLISLVVGILVGFLMKLIFRWFKKPSNQLSISIASILLAYWVSDSLYGSSLLSCMALGATMANIYRAQIDQLVKITEEFTPPVFMLFFVVSGAGFQVSALSSIGLIGILYVVARVIGKITGAYIGGRLTGQDQNTCRYLGPTLMPQAGVALGLIVAASQVVPDYANQIQVIVLCSTFIYSLIGPVVAKQSLIKAGEIQLENKGVPRQAHS